MQLLKYTAIILALSTTTLAITSCGDDDTDTEVTVQKYDQSHVTVYLAIYENQQQYVKQSLVLGMAHQYKAIAWSDFTEVSADAVPVALSAIGKQAETQATGTTESGKVKYFAYTNPTVYDGKSGSARIDIKIEQIEYDEEEGINTPKDKFNLLVAGVVSVRLRDSASDASYITNSKIESLTAITEINNDYNDLSDAAKVLFSNNQSYYVNY